MKLVASLIVRNEIGRYLEPCIDHLLEFCDQVVVKDDGSNDGTWEWIWEKADRDRRVFWVRSDQTRFFEHEGMSRNDLLHTTLSVEPTHVLAIDADEFVSDGTALRRACEGPRTAWTLDMVEVWRAFDDCLCVRLDGGWRPHLVPVLWQVPPRLSSGWRIADRALACGRVPIPVDRLGRTAIPTGVQLLHFGWANEAERAARHHRYAVADGGRFHASQHLDSIMWPDEKVGMQGIGWPAALQPYRERILERTRKGATMADNPKVTKVRVYEDAAGEYRWQALAGNHVDVLADSGEGYTNASWARQAAESLFPDVEFVDETTAEWKAAHAG